jgi:hypothetical protein
MVQDWVEIPQLVSIEKVVDGAHANNLTIILMKALEQEGGLQVDDIALKLLYFGIDLVVTS